MIGGILIDIQIAEAYKNVEVENLVTVTEPREVAIEVVIDWTPERIAKEIRDTFPEAPETAVKIAKCESGLVPTVQSHHRQSYGQERSFGIMQIHAPDWEDDAIRLGYKNYRTDVRENLKMARYIYEKAGNSFQPWSCYSKKMI